MKQLRFIFCLAVLSLGLGLSSCNKAESGPMQWGEVVKINFDRSFTNMAGIKLVPTNSFNLGSASMAYVFYSVGEQIALPNGSALSVTLLMEPQIIDASAFVVDQQGSPDDIKANTAIYTLNVDAETPTLFDSRTLVLPVAFFVKNVNSETDLATELAKHKFQLVCYEDTITEGDTELKLYLRHVIDGEITPARFNQKAWLFKAYDLNNILQNYAFKSGKSKPSKIVLYTEENTSSDELETGFAHQTIYKLDYSFE